MTNNFRQIQFMSATLGWYLLERYPLKGNSVFLGRVAHSAMIGRPVAYLDEKVHVSVNQYPEGHWERVKTEYWARRLIWC